MSYKITVFYPNNEDSKFDKDYYLSTHMPLVEKHWKPFGLESWDVVEFDAAAKGPYIIGASMTWKDKESSQKAFAAESVREIMADVANFSNYPASRVAGAVLAKSKF